MKFLQNESKLLIYLLRKKENDSEKTHPKRDNQNQSFNLRKN